MAEIVLKGLTKTWGSARALDGIDLTLADGELVAILGPSGCGKSTTLFLLAGIYAPTAGEILFDGVRVNEVEARDRNIGIVFQSYALYPHMTVAENIRFPLRFQKVSPAEAADKALEFAKLVQVDHLTERKPSQLSGGQQQRVALARALIKAPHLLLLDEPLSNLDATLRLTMRTEIRKLQRRLGVTTVLVTHDQLEATTMADRIVCMNAARIEQVGTPEDLYERPDTVFVAGFIGSPPMNLVEGRVEAGAFRTGDCRIPVVGAGEGAAVLGLRPERLQAAEIGLVARIASIEPMGREVLYAADTELGSLRFLETTPLARFKPDDEIRLAFAPEHAMLFSSTTGRRMADARLAPTRDAVARQAG